MKTIKAFVLLVMISAISWAADWETYELIDRLLTLPGPGAPVIFEDAVIFTASSDVRRIGVAFAHENFTNVYWYRHLLIPQDRLFAPIPEGKKEPDPYIEAGFQFHIFEVPKNIRELEYRLIINGLWTIDPTNPNTRRDPVSGISLSVLSIPYRAVNPHPLNGLPSGLDFTFKGPPGETVTVAGNFNSWDPFMYELKEGPGGIYSINIPLPSGTYQYVFFHRGQRYLDPYNSSRIYSRDGSAASVIIIP
ncbi:MAG: isoamylase [Treponema sp.]|nr:isoamylase [Treponema sp.]